MLCSFQPQHPKIFIVKHSMFATTNWEKAKSFDEIPSYAFSVSIYLLHYYYYYYRFLFRNFGFESNIKIILTVTSNDWYDYAFDCTLFIEFNMSIWAMVNGRQTFLSDICNRMIKEKKEKNSNSLVAIETNETKTTNKIK